MKYSEAVKLLDDAKWEIQSKLGINKGKKIVSYQWRKVEGGFEFYRDTDIREYKMITAHSSHDWMKQRPYKTKSWVTLESKSDVLFKGVGSKVLDFMRNFKGELK